MGLPYDWKVIYHVSMKRSLLNIPQKNTLLMVSNIKRQKLMCDITKAVFIL